MHYFSGKVCSESLESMHYCIGILNNKIDIENNPILRRITYIVFPVWDLKGLVEEFQKMI